MLLALLVGAVVLLLLGADPLAYYGYVLKRGLLTWSGLQETIIRMAPLLLIAAGLIIAFRRRHLEPGRGRPVPARRRHHVRRSRRRWWERSGAIRRSPSA